MAHMIRVCNLLREPLSGNGPWQTELTTRKPQITGEGLQNPWLLFGKLI